MQGSPELNAFSPNVETDGMASNTRDRGIVNQHRARPGRTKRDQTNQEVAKELTAVGEGLGEHEARLREREGGFKNQVEELEERKRKLAEQERRLHKEKRVFLDAKRKYLAWEEENSQLREQMRRLKDILEKLGLSWVVKDALSQGDLARMGEAEAHAVAGYRGR